MPKTGIATINEISDWKRLYRELVDTMKDDGFSFRDVYNLLNGWLSEEYDKEYPDDDD